MSPTQYSRRTVRRHVKTGARSAVAPVGVSTNGARELRALLDRVHAFITTYVSLPSEEAAWAITLWVVHTYLIDAFSYTPRLALLSRLRGSGKSRCLNVLASLVHNRLSTFNSSVAALFRTIDADKRTILMDECDTYLGLRAAHLHEDLRGLVNAGFERGAEVARCEKQGGEIKVTSFRVFAPMALAGLGELPDMILDRSILIQMRPKRSTDDVASFRSHLVEADAKRLRASITKWAATWTAAIRSSPVQLPDDLRDRAADIWEPLIAIGEAADGRWSECAKRAALRLSAERQDAEPNEAFRLLADIGRVLIPVRATNISSEGLIEALRELDDSEWCGNRPIEPRRLAQLLKDFDTYPRNVRSDGNILRGYPVADLREACDRYLQKTPTPATAPRRTDNPSMRTGGEPSPSDKRKPRSRIRRTGTTVGSDRTDAPSRIQEHVRRVRRSSSQASG